MAALYSLYRNLHKKDTASIRFKGIVVDYVKEAILSDCVFSVSEKGRLRVVKNFKKNVHSLIKAKKYKSGSFRLDEFEELYYNPYFTQYFYCVRTGRKCLKAEQVIFKNNKVYAKNITEYSK